MDIIALTDAAQHSLCLQLTSFRYRLPSGQSFSLQAAFNSFKAAIGPQKLKFALKKQFGRSSVG
jgi:hypothetical protein